MASNTPRKQPILTDAGKADAEARFQRRAAALRENLQKRKAQSRARAPAPPRPAADPPDKA